jgi:hypothetical protein
LMVPVGKSIIHPNPGYSAVVIHYEYPRYPNGQ